MDSIRGVRSVQSAAYVERARDWAMTLEDETARARGEPVVVVRPEVAREVGTTAGTLANLRNRRRKGVAAELYEALQRAVMRRLQARLRHLEHEITILRSQGLDPRDGDMAAALSDRAAVRKALGLREETGGET